MIFFCFLIIGMLAQGFKSTIQEMSESDSVKGKGENGEREEKDSASCEEKMKVHRGERYLHDIQLETMVRSSIGENENNSWYS